MDKPWILIVEDEEKIARVLELELSFEGYNTGKAFTGSDGLKMFHDQSWNLVLLDIMLPEMSGVEVLRRIRANDTHTPVILLTAKNSVEDKVSGLDLGANDYITKPFQMEEVLARVRAALRLNPKPIEDSVDDGWIQVGDLKLNELSREVKRGNKAIDLTQREFDLLAYLMQHERQVLNREQILNGVWGYDFYGDTNIVDVYIRYLRNKMDKGYEQPLIHTVRGVGYVLKDSQ
ncbi:response regulator transcription factor [Siminovitchia acidinfaciens]|uniref:Response regulator transcription factor n=1 Tax=Siminovitchia acidinfaciens TaxID=2321395 RepID=A0A429XXB6_9BACI|nr:response regulator transcription factor [Siminovitchia acidinfaciens]RST73147.1 response regulator transcription factor [Siminovitchia acidinfaciens]